VTAEIDENQRDVNSLTVNTALQKKFSDIEERYPGYTVSYEGEFKDTEESMAELLQSFLIAVLIIYLILVSLFRSLLYPLIILMVIPLTFTGVVWIFFFHNLPVSFLAVLGVVGLAGVVVNDSILLMDFIKKARRRGVEPIKAAIESGVTRLRPVFLTTITTFLGLIPTAYGIGGYDPFLKPMAISLSWGLFFGTTVTLVGIPVIYTIFSDINRYLSRKRGI
jgi:multidrug efflux pump subunit AcrB